MISPKHPLVKLAAVIDWDEIGQSFGAHFESRLGRPALSPRLVAGLLYLQHAYDCSDEAVINTWVENPYFQHFTGETYFQTEAPMDSSSLTRWRKRIGEEGVETMLMATIDAARKIGMIKASSLDRVIVDTTVMPKAIAHPTDSRLLEKSRQHLVKAAEEGGIALRQNYNREGPRVALQIGRYAHARQFKRMGKALRHLKTRVGRVHREVERKLDHGAHLPQHVEAAHAVITDQRIHQGVLEGVAHVQGAGDVGWGQQDAEGVRFFGIEAGAEIASGFPFGVPATFDVSRFKALGEFHGGGRRDGRSAHYTRITHLPQ